jgi:hypothetical protein
MKKTFTILFCLSAVAAFAQPIERAFTFQGVLFDSITGNAQSFKQITTQVSILSASGTLLYRETQPNPATTLITKKYGQFEYKVGKGVPVFGQFDTLNWASAKKMRTVITVTSTGATLTANDDITPVPQAMYALKANESQTLALSGSNLSISGGNSVNLNNAISSGSVGQQIIRSQSYSSSSSYNAYPGLVAATSNTTGSELYMATGLHTQGGGQVIDIYHYNRQSGSYYEKNTVDLPYVSINGTIYKIASIGGMCVKDSFLYVSYTKYIDAYPYTNILSVFRVSANNPNWGFEDLPTLGGNINSIAGTIHTDGTYLYLASQSGTFKYSIINNNQLLNQGTVLIQSSSHSFYDGNKVYQLSGSSGIVNLYRNSLTGTLENSTTINTPFSSYGSTAAGLESAGIGNIDAQTLFTIVRKAQYITLSSNNSIAYIDFYLVPIPKP